MGSWANRTAQAAVRIAVFFTLALPASAQFLPELQANSPAEYDAYLDAIDEPAAQRPAKAREFLRLYPASELRLPIWELIAEHARQAGNGPAAKSAAEEGLRIAPGYIPLLTLLASVEANTNPKPNGTHAEEALQLLEQARASVRVDAESWRRAVNRMRAENLATLGIVAFKSGRSADAVRLLEESYHLDTTDTTAYRLGVLLRETGANARARTLLEQASASADPELSKRARAALLTLDPKR